MTSHRIFRVLAATAVISFQFGCSGESSTDSNGGAATAGSGANVDNERDDAGGAPGAAGSGATGFDAGMDRDFASLTCATTTTLQSGRSYGDYTLFAIRIDPTLAPGIYAPWANRGGNVQVFSEDGTFVAEDAYDEEASLVNGAEQTVTVSGLFELDFRSQAQPTLAGLSESAFDGCHRILVESPTVIVPGSTYGQILVEAVTIHPSAASGSYTLFAASGNAGQVELRRAGASLAVLDYDWQTSIGAGNGFSFVFPELLTLSVTRSTGTSNLFPVADALFDDRHSIVVP